jgi:hypothetical protein
MKKIIFLISFIFKLQILLSQNQNVGIGTLTPRANALKFQNFKQIFIIPSRIESFSFDASFSFFLLLDKV